MAQRLGVQYDEISIKPEFDAYLRSLEKEFKGLQIDTTEENIQARIRGTLLMALSNKRGSIVLTTGNKSEMATGYCTLYGDMAGGFAVIKDVAKTMVFNLARWRNANDPFEQNVKNVRHPRKDRETQHQPYVRGHKLQGNYKTRGTRCGFYHTLRMHIGGVIFHFPKSARIGGFEGGGSAF